MYLGRGDVLVVGEQRLENNGAFTGPVWWGMHADLWVSVICVMTSAGHTSNTHTHRLSAC